LVINLTTAKTLGITIPATEAIADGVTNQAANVPFWHDSDLASRQPLSALNGNGSSTLVLPRCAITGPPRDQLVNDSATPHFAIMASSGLSGWPKSGPLRHHVRKPSERIPSPKRSGAAMRNEWGRQPRAGLCFHRGREACLFFRRHFCWTDG
jgi:hypothetical protein